MKIQRQRIIFIIFFLISIVTGYIFWDLINLKFNDPDIIGEYSVKSYNSANDISSSSNNSLENNSENNFYDDADT